ncbi:hypothetical protein [Gelidibacter sp.]|uniref:hypothetical protein n=1 Tax=Gelidibacter sp. TaxID=2018083 RepID=UPI00326305BB
MFFFTLLIGCKKINENIDSNESLKADENIGVISDQNGTEQLNKSDVSFGEALSAYSNKEYKKAGDLIATGANELTEEAKTKGSEFKEELNISIKHLTDIAKEIQNGQQVDEKVLCNMIANAEINVNHPYLASENFYMLTEPEKVNDYRFDNSLDYHLKSLEAGTKKLEGDSKKEAEKLDTEGKRLKEELKVWNNRAEAHANKTLEHFKKYQPEYVPRMYPMMY